jgi:hypothetical protein
MLGGIIVLLVILVIVGGVYCGCTPTLPARAQRVPRVEIPCNNECTYTNTELHYKTCGRYQESPYTCDTTCPWHHIAGCHGTKKF